MLPGIICSAVIIGVLIYFIDWSVLTEALKNCSVKLFLIIFPKVFSAQYCGSGYKKLCYCSEEGVGTESGSCTDQKSRRLQR